MGEQRSEDHPIPLDDLVVRIAAEHDRDAFGELFRAVAPRVKAFVMRSGASAEIAEEIAQETMLTVWRKASYFDSARASASTWIFTIARNLRIDAQRRKANRHDPLPDMTEVPCDAPTPEEAMMNLSREQRVAFALGALSEEQAEIVRLSFFNDVPHSEIARQLGIPLGTVKSRARLALARLRKLLEEVA